MPADLSDAAPKSGLRRLLGEAAWLGRGRVTAWASILLLVEFGTLIFLIAGTHGLIVPLDRANSTDYASFYAAGALTDAGTPALAYDQTAHYAAEQQATEAGIPYQYFFYPPPMLLLCALLPGLPYLLSFVVFQALSLGLMLLVARAILRERGWGWHWIAPVVACPAAFYVMGLGQNSFLTAALFGAGTLLVDRRPWLAGLMFGLMCYKPHFGLLIPVALLAGGHWRATVSASLTVAAIVALTAALFGIETWRAFFAVFAQSPALYQSGRIELAGFVSVFGAALLTGAAPGIAYGLQIAASLIAAAIVGWIWWRGSSLPVRAAALLAGSVVAVPLALIYDLMIVLAGGIWLVRLGRERGFLSGEKLLLMAAFLVPLASRSVGLALHIPIGFLAAAIPLALCVRHALAEPRRA